MRRWQLSNAKYCGNRVKKEVHDLDDEKIQCQIDEILRTGHAVPFNSLEEAHRQGYDNCAYCLGGSRR